MKILDRYTVADSRQVLHRIRTGAVGLVVTDPPYGIRWRRTSIRCNCKTEKPILSGDTPSEAIALLRAIVPELARVMKPGAMIYVFGPGGRNVFCQGTDFARCLETAFDIRQALIWDKASIGPGCYWRGQWELIIMASLGRIDSWTGGLARSNILRYGRVQIWPNGHPTPKPPALIKELIECSSRPGDLVLDPFAGSGVVGAVARDLGRRFICIDVDPRWAPEARDRYGLTVQDLRESRRAG